MNVDDYMVRVMRCGKCRVYDKQHCGLFSSVDADKRIGFAASGFTSSTACKFDLLRGYDGFGELTKKQVIDLTKRFSQGFVQEGITEDDVDLDSLRRGLRRSLDDGEC